MKDYLEERNQNVIYLQEKMRELRDAEIENNGEHAKLFAGVVCELSYRIAEKSDFVDKTLS